MALKVRLYGKGKRIHVIPNTLFSKTLPLAKVILWITFESKKNDEHYTELRKSNKDMKDALSIMYSCTMNFHVS